MTYNQIQRAKLEEDKRHNEAVELETKRSNLAKEGETARSNRENERITETFNQAKIEQIQSDLGVWVTRIVKAYGADQFIGDIEEYGVLGALKRLFSGKPANADAGLASEIASTTQDIFDTIRGMLNPNTSPDAEANKGTYVGAKPLPHDKTEVPMGQIDSVTGRQVPWNGPDNRSSQTTQVRKNRKEVTK